jgi:hypothetical protein
LGPTECDSFVAKTSTAKVLAHETHECHEKRKKQN